MLNRRDRRVAFNYEQAALPKKERSCPRCLGDRVIFAEDDEQEFVILLTRLAPVPVLNPYMCPECYGTGEERHGEIATELREQVIYEFQHHHENLLVQFGVQIGLQQGREDLWFVCLYPWELEDIGEYSCSMPTGQVPYKVWRRNENFGAPRAAPHWILGQYIPHIDENKIGIRWYEIYFLQGPQPFVVQERDWDNYARWLADREVEKAKRNEQRTK